MKHKQILPTGRLLAIVANAIRDSHRNKKLSINCNLGIGEIEARAAIMAVIGWQRLNLRCGIVGTEKRRYNPHRGMPPAPHGIHDGTAGAVGEGGGGYFDLGNTIS